jgi:isocitrate dehydrogenase
MFEAIHGSAPRRAGQNLANPSGLFLGAVMMLVHIGQTDVAERAHNAWLRTMEDGVHTYDIFKEGVSKEKVGTREFAEAVVARMGQKPETLKAVTYKSGKSGGADSASPSGGASRESAAQKKETVGVDVYLEWTGGSADDLGAAVSKLSGGGLKLTSIANRGVKVYPGGATETFCSDHWRCRFASEDAAAPVSHAQIAELLSRFAEAGLDFIKTENLCDFDGKPGYSHAQE